MGVINTIKNNRIRKDIGEIALTENEAVAYIIHEEFERVHEKDIYEKKKQLTPTEMFLLEKLIYTLTDELPKQVWEYSDKELAEMFDIEVRYAQKSEMPSGVISLIKPSELHNAAIKVPYEKRNVSNYFMSEIVVYLLYKRGDRLETTHARKIKEPIDKYTLQRDYVTRCILFPRVKVSAHLYDYDNSHPKLDELDFVSGLSKRYCLSIKDVIRRIQEVRILNSTEKYIGTALGKMKV